MEVKVEAKLGNQFRQRRRKAYLNWKLEIQHQPQSGRCNLEWGLF